MKYLYLILVFGCFAYGADRGIFPTPASLNMNKQDYYALCGLLGIVCGHIFWDKLFR